jgi:putative transposase
LVARFALIAVEDLNLRGMVRSASGTVEVPGTKVAQKRGLNRAIHDQAWGSFLQMLAYKAEEAGGRVVKVDPRGTSETCTKCGRRDARSRKGARFCCVICGKRMDADTNAAQVVLARAVARIEQVEQEDQGPGRGLQAETPALARVV